MFNLLLNSLPLVKKGNISYGALLKIRHVPWVNFLMAVREIRKYVAVSFDIDNKFLKTSRTGSETYLILFGNLLPEVKESPTD